MPVSYRWRHAAFRRSRLELRKIDLQRVCSDCTLINDIRTRCQLRYQIRHRDKATQNAGDRQDRTGDSKWRFAAHPWSCFRLTAAIVAWLSRIIHGLGLRYARYRPSAKSESTEKSKKSPNTAHFNSTARMEKQRGKVPSKLPAFLTALLFFNRFTAKNAAKASPAMPCAPQSATVDET